MSVDKRFEQLFAQQIPALNAGLAVSMKGAQATPPKHLGTITNLPGIARFDQLNDFFETPDLDKMVTAAHSGKGGPESLTNARIAMKLQSDLLSQLERDYKQRYTSRIRLMAHEASRRLNHSEKQGAVLSNVVQGIYGILALSK